MRTCVVSALTFLAVACGCVDRPLTEDGNAALRGSHDGGAARSADGGIPGAGGGPGAPPAPSPTMTGARWTDFRLVRPTCIAPLANITYPRFFADGTFVQLVAASQASGTTEIVGGTGTRVSDTPPVFSFVDTMAPSPVPAETVARPDGRTDFATTTPFAWSLPFMPDQPWLPLHGATLAGSLDAQGVPTSDVPPVSGTVTGCVTVAETQQVRVEVLAQTVYELITSSGGAPDADCGTGAGDGFVFEGRWEAAEVVTLEGGS